MTGPRDEPAPPDAAPLLRPAGPADVGAVLALVRELAAYEREPDAVEATEPALATALFGPQPAAWCHVVEHPGPDGPELAAFALWFPTFSTWTGRPGLHLEDLYVRPEHRGRGYGRALLRELARVCVERGWGRLEWAVLDWNVDAQRFYRGLGAAPMEEWTTWRVAGPALAALAASR